MMAERELILQQVKRAATCAKYTDAIPGDPPPAPSSARDDDLALSQRAPTASTLTARTEA
jgi:hypothetical protein